MGCFDLWGLQITGEDVVFQSEEPFTEMRFRISLAPVSLQLKIDEELGPTLIWIALKARGKMAHESQPRLIECLTI